jgi:stearoyl-CoA desaturase (Delta-9 desaturase)
MLTPTSPKAAPEPISYSVRIANLVAVVVPFVGLGIAVAGLWGRGFSWVEFGLLGGMYVLTGLGISVGFHRLFCHRSFETNRVVQFVLAALGSMALQGPLLKWVAIHRHHHQRSDERDDPHSPHHQGRGIRGLLRGIWHAHLGWVFRPEPPNLSRYVKDLVHDTPIHLASMLFPLWAAAGLIIPAALGGLLTGTWRGAVWGFLWGGLARIFLVHHLTWSVNSVCHLWGRRPFRNRDHSSNNFILGVLALGEGWHNNHHAFPTSARHGLRWWQIDVSYWFIRGLALVGLAWDVKVPGKQQLLSQGV